MFIPNPGHAIERGAAYRQAAIRLGLLPLNLPHLERDLEQIREDMSTAVEQLLETVGKVRLSTMPLCPKASRAAPDLQIKCWGLQWSTVRSELVASHLFPAMEVLMSLCSAFLLTIFDRDYCSACTEFRSWWGSGANEKTIAPPPEDRKCP
jgi:hypothetical protein